MTVFLVLLACGRDAREKVPSEQLEFRNSCAAPGEKSHACAVDRPVHAIQRIRFAILLFEKHQETTLRELNVPSRFPAAREVECGVPALGAKSQYPNAP